MGGLHVHTTFYRGPTCRYGTQLLTLLLRIRYSTSYEHTGCCTGNSIHMSYMHITCPILRPTCTYQEILCITYMLIACPALHMEGPTNHVHIGGRYGMHILAYPSMYSPDVLHMGYIVYLNKILIIPCVAFCPIWHRIITLWWPLEYACISQHTM